MDQPINGHEEPRKYEITIFLEVLSGKRKGDYFQKSYVSTTETTGDEAIYALISTAKSLLEEVNKGKRGRRCLSLEPSFN